MGHVWRLVVGGFVTEEGDVTLNDGKEETNRGEGAWTSNNGN